MKISELPAEIREKALEYQKNEVRKNYDKDTDDLRIAFMWENTEEDYDFWHKWHKKPFVKQEPPAHYDNSNGSIYKFCNDQKLNSYEFDLIKRIVRCRKKGSFIEDLQKTKDLIDLYMKEHESK